MTEVKPGDRVKPRCGYIYRTDDGSWITVIRVARDASWADIRVDGAGAASGWSKRQPLDDGLFPSEMCAHIWDTT